MKYRDFIRILKDHDFAQVRQRGSHRTFEGFVGGRRRMVLVAYHKASDDIMPKNFKSMIRQSGLPKKTFR